MRLNPKSLLCRARLGLRPALRLLILLLLCSPPAHSQDGVWSRQKTGSLAWLHGVFFLDENRGWAIGSKGTLLKTRDGGVSWQVGTKPSPDILRDLYFVDEQNGWILCEANVYELKHKEDPRTYVIQTTDGGESWKRADISDGDSRLVRMVFSKGGRIWAFGEGGTIFTTRDSGLTWAPVPSPTRHLLLGGVFLDDERGWLVGAGATIMQTSDGGSTWQLVRLTEASQGAVRFAAISFIDPHWGWAVGSGGSVYHTSNGGRSWRRQASPVAADLLDVKFLDAFEGWAVGAEGTIIHTVDGGEHWTVEPSGTEHSLERVFFLNRDHGWVSGFGGTLLHYRRLPAKR